MLRLRELERRDIPIINEWRARRDVVASLASPFRHVGIEVDEAWFDSYLASRRSTVRCVIENDSTDCPVAGLVTLSEIDWVHRSATLGIQIGDPCNQGKGMGSFGVREMLRHAFVDLGLNRVQLNVLADNERAVHLYVKCGFSHEGVRREAVYKNGGYVDLLMMSILRDEWEEEPVRPKSTAPHL